MNRTDTDIIIRSALSTDAAEISALYGEAYSPNGKMDARLYYPFPQFLNPQWIKEALQKDALCWLVAISNKVVVGTVGALLNIGDKDDHITESFGLVIRKDFRNRRIGTRLYEYLSTTTQGRSLFLIAETRTAHPGGYCIVRRCKLIPIGFEPLAHFTPNGHESMLVTAKIDPDALKKRQPTLRLTDKAYAVAACVLQTLETTPNGTESRFGSGIEADRSLNLPPRAQRPTVNHRQYIRDLPADLRIKVKRDDIAGARFFRHMGDTQRSHQSGVICLSRLEGEDHDDQRYEHQFFLAEINHTTFAGARFALDKIDKRNRLLSFQSRYGDHEDVILVHILRFMARTVRSPMFQVVIDIRADDLRIQEALESLDFFPTTFYPAIIDHDGARVDGIQYTLFTTAVNEEKISIRNKLEWPAAQSLADQVLQLFRSTRKKAGS